MTDGAASRTGPSRSTSPPAIGGKTMSKQLGSGPFVEPIDVRVVDSTRDAAELRARSDAVARGGARAAVLGVNDGLVTNVCLILAMAGATDSQSAVRLAGFASLIAGALSMAAGEWVSVKSQVELFEGILSELRALIRRNPQLVLGELSAKLQDAGLARETAQRASTELPLSGDKFLDFTARTVFGLNPDELGSPRIAALSSLALFAVGAIIPLAPWFFTSGTVATVISVAATGVASLAVGGWVSSNANRPLVLGALRQLGIVIIASAITYAIGAIFGTTVS
jgi:vacuolar iron transporter family protein